MAASPGYASDRTPVASPNPKRKISYPPRCVKQTYVTIRKDVADSAPFWEGTLYPDAGPLKLTGRKFWMKLKDPASIPVTQDCQPFSVEARAISKSNDFHFQNRDRQAGNANLPYWLPPFPSKWG